MDQPKHHDGVKWVMITIFGFLVSVAIFTVAFWPDVAIFAITIWLVRAAFFIAGLALFFLCAWILFVNLTD